ARKALILSISQSLSGGSAKFSDFRRFAKIWVDREKTQQSEFSVDCARSKANSSGEDPNRCVP
ncbi:MAG: hypothetical protein AAF327_12985, partial [Cyanobacteria bacterium P01_A01_bin.37]